MADCSAGVLYVVATPIGHMEDITLRALRVLGECDLVLAEDTRHTRKLLAHHGIRTRLLSYHAHNERQRTSALIQRLEAGAQLALVSDAGTPSLSDPGYVLVQEAAQRGFRVCPIPGPSALMAALCAAGLPTEEFLFLGFPPRKAQALQQMLQSLQHEPRTLIWYESPRRITTLLEAIEATLGDRPAVVAREITKRHEEFLRGTLSVLRTQLLARDTVKGEITLLVGGGAQPQAAPREVVWEALRERLRNRRQPASQLARECAAEFNWPRSEIYALILKIQNGTR
jgi:16S rRNA (cytidine1402-2'-O)-methyltransferase